MAVSKNVMKRVVLSRWRDDAPGFATTPRQSSVTAHDTSVGELFSCMLARREVIEQSDTSCESMRLAADSANDCCLAGVTSTDAAPSSVTEPDQYSDTEEQKPTKVEVEFVLLMMGTQAVPTVRRRPGNELEKISPPSSFSCLVLT